MENLKRGEIRLLHLACLEKRWKRKKRVERESKRSRGKWVQKTKISPFWTMKISCIEKTEKIVKLDITVMEMCLALPAN